ncbi:hypothetical protein LRR18_05940 [Mangrovimonas sp. AS39]|uniref:hypothetical protein n=1 Tax=Mangrovimonas TaxID=1211036 RepID=UPI0006B56B8C|nr:MULTISPECIES: hypothetical protein [Mangrovimonas]MCF1191120.1 hypothetical protein [Mangrovimonas futianensis]MCF1194815.1 hypothetical protein [Mangrovimonas futianensis]MCF1420578.1 hypothetical protein [Mangrovimonas futianensis]
MKSFKLLIILAVTVLFSCNKDDDDNNRNPYLPNVSFDTGNMINTNLPQYSDLNFTGNHKVVPGEGVGIRGIVVYNTGSGYTAFEIADPNHTLQTCSTLTVDGIIATCNCDDGNSYDIVTGSPQEGTNGPYALLNYRVQVSGSIIRVYN